MPNNRILSSLTSRDTMKFLFLASHGLRTPLSSIRWGTGRLKKMREGNMTPEEKRVVDQVYNSARKLTTVLGSMLILAKLEEGAYQHREEKINIRELLNFLIESLEDNTCTWDVQCPTEFSLLADRLLLETIVRDFLSIAAEASMQGCDVMVKVHTQDRRLVLRLYAPMELPFLHNEGDRESDEISRLVGGTPGLLLSLTGALARFLEGNIELARVDAEELREMKADDIDLDDLDEEEYRVTLTFPLSY